MCGISNSRLNNKLLNLFKYIVLSLSFLFAFFDNVDIKVYAQEVQIAEEIIIGEDGSEKIVYIDRIRGESKEVQLTFNVEINEDSACNFTTSANVVKTTCNHQLNEDGASVITFMLTAQGAGKDITLTFFNDYNITYTLQRLKINTSATYYESGGSNKYMYGQKMSAQEIYLKYLINDSEMNPIEFNSDAGCSVKNTNDVTCYVVPENNYVMVKIEVKGGYFGDINVVLNEGLLNDGYHGSVEKNIEIIIKEAKISYEVPGNQINGIYYTNENPVIITVKNYDKVVKILDYMLEDGQTELSVNEQKNQTITFDCDGLSYEVEMESFKFLYDNISPVFEIQTEQVEQGMAKIEYADIKITGMDNEIRKISNHLAKWINTYIKAKDKGQELDFTVELIVEHAKGENIGEYARYAYKLTCVDVSGNVAELDYTFLIVESSIPTNGKITLSYDKQNEEASSTGKIDVKGSKIYFKLSDGDDEHTSIKYYYSIAESEYKLIQKDTYLEVDVTKLNNVNLDRAMVSLKYKVLDYVGNESNEKEITLLFDIKAPEIIISNNNCTALSESGNLLIYEKPSNGMECKIIIENVVDEGAILEKNLSKNGVLDEQGFKEGRFIKQVGYYKIEVSDDFGNKAELGVMLLSGNKKYKVDGQEKEKEYDKVMVSKINMSTYEINVKEVQSLINEDKVYVMGVLQTRTDTILTMIDTNEYITGEKIKENKGKIVLQLNEDYNLENNVIEINGESYILLCVDEASRLNNDTDITDDPTNENNNQNNGGNISDYSLLIIGGVLAVGVILFFIRKMKKNIRAA